MMKNNKIRATLISQIKLTGLISDELLLNKMNDVSLMDCAIDVICGLTLINGEYKELITDYEEMIESKKQKIKDISESCLKE